MRFWHLCVLAFALGINCAFADDGPPATAVFPAHSVWGDYDAAPRLPDGHVDIDTTVARLKELHANTYLWLVYTIASDWSDLEKFLPKAAESGIDVWVYLVPPSEPPAPEPFKYDYQRWGGEIAKLSLQHSNLTAWVIDDFYANKSTLTPKSVREFQSAAKSINPRLAFLPLMYFPELEPEFLRDYREIIDGVVVAYPRDREEIRKAFAVLNDRPWTDFEFKLGHRTPTKAGDFVAAKQNAAVLGAGRQVLRFREFGGYAGTPAGYHFKELLVDGAVAWKEDAADGRTWWHDVEVDVTPFVHDKKQVAISFQLTEKRGVSDFPFIWSLCDLSAQGLRLDADFAHPEKWSVEKKGPFQDGFGPEPGQVKGNFHIPFIVMTAASQEEFKGRHGEPASPEQIAGWARFCLEASRAGLCDGVVTFALDKAPESRIFDAIRKEYLDFEKSLPQK